MLDCLRAPFNDFEELDDLPLKALSGVENSEAAELGDR